MWHGHFWPRPSEQSRALFVGSASSRLGSGDHALAHRSFSLHHSRDRHRSRDDNFIGDLAIGCVRSKQPFHVVVLAFYRAEVNCKWIDGALASPGWEKRDFAAGGGQRNCLSCSAEYPRVLSLLHSPTRVTHKLDHKAPQNQWDEMLHSRVCRETERRDISDSRFQTGLCRVVLDFTIHTVEGNPQQRDHQEHKHTALRTNRPSR